MLRSFWFAPVANTEGFRRERISDWLSAGNFQCVGRTNGSYEFVWFNESELVAAFAGDADRFASAALESLVFAYYSRGKSLADGQSWKYITLYYAAYFAATSLLKCCGRSVSFVEGQELKVLQQVVYQSWPHSGVPPKLGSGVYELIVDQKARLLTLKKAKAARAHSALWRAFTNLNEDMESQLTTLGGAAVLPLVSDQLRRLRYHLGNVPHQASNGDALSIIRNAINYRQEYNVWFPYASSCGLSKLDKKEIAGKISDCDEMTLPETNVGRHEAFCDVSKFLVGVCFNNAQELAFRGRGQKSFVKKGCLRFAAEQELL